jgi:uncharacterized membrane protein
LFQHEENDMAEHYASVTIDAPVHQIYSLFTHLNDFPTFMYSVKEVTASDTQRTHWVVHLLQDFEWDAVNEDWIPDQQIGWRSIRGFFTCGKVKFRSIEPGRTMLDVYLHYTPPFGPFGRLLDLLGIGGRINALLKENLAHFARMVEQMPSESLDPLASHYLFHPRSAFASQTLTPRYKRAMRQDPRMSANALAARQTRIEQEQQQQRLLLLQRVFVEQEQHAQVRQVEQVQHTLLAQEALKRLQERKELAEEQALREPERRVLHPVYDTLGGRDASRERTAFGDRDGLRPRHPEYERSPMSARYPFPAGGANPTRPLTEEDEDEETSPWFSSIRGTPMIALPPKPDAESSGVEQE